VGSKPAQAADRGAGGQGGLLRERRDVGQAQVVKVRARDHGEPERARHALTVRLAVGSESEHRRDEALDPSGGLLHSTLSDRRIRAHRENPPVGKG
jgi:hypothetical protein